MYSPDELRGLLNAISFSTVFFTVRKVNTKKQRGGPFPSCWEGERLVVILICLNQIFQGLSKVPELIQVLWPCAGIELNSVDA